MFTMATFMGTNVYGHTMVESVAFSGAIIATVAILLLGFLLILAANHNL
jgi:hypothetical protein